jgi:hypothetical protein
MSQALQDLLSVFTEEQVKQLIEMCKRISKRASDRGTEQSVIITFNSKSWPVHFNGTDNEKPVRPAAFE